MKENGNTIAAFLDVASTYDNVRTDTSADTRTAEREMSKKLEIY